MSLIKIQETSESIISNKEFSPNKACSILGTETIAILGYGIQGSAQAKNLRDNGYSVLVGQRKESPSWQKALDEKWIPTKNLFSITEAAEKSSIIVLLTPDLSHASCLKAIAPYLTEGKMLIFAHGFTLTFQEIENIKLPDQIDISLVAPKSSGNTVREKFIQKKGFNASYAVYQDKSSRALEKTIAYGIAIGVENLFLTTINNETYSDLVGERGILLGALTGIILAQYEVLRSHGHSPTEAYNETIEELTESIVPLISANGLSNTYKACSITAQIGALKWQELFKEINKPLFETLYNQVLNGTEAEEVLNTINRQNYLEILEKQIDLLESDELKTVGKLVRSMRS
jgi:ketol-acid reductoisomerase